MANHKKPTEDELKAEIDKNLKELDKPEVPVVEEPIVPEVPPTPEPEIPSIPPATPVIEPVPIPDEVVVPTPEPDGNGGNLPSVENRYKESSNEAKILYARNKAMNEAVINAKQLPDPTEEELQKANPDWDVMTDFERKTAKSNFINERRWQILDDATKPFVDKENWLGEVTTFIETESNIKKYPELAGKEQQFVEYATRLATSGVSFELIIPAFLHNESLKKVPNKGQMFPTGSGGPNELPKPKVDMLTVAEGAALMKTNMEEYRIKLQAGKISLDPDYKR